MIFALDHLVVLVGDLDQAQADWRAQGFAVVYGGEHTDGATHNALVALADGSYIELLAFKREEPSHHWWRHVAYGPGVIDFALLSARMDVDLEAVRARGISIEGPIAGGRLRPDGEEIAWQIAVAHFPDVPFLCADVTPRNRRVPQLTDEQRAGATGIASVTILVESIAEAVRRYAALLDRSPVKDAELEPGVAWSAAFQLGPTRVELVQPLPEASSHPLAQRLATRGPGIVAYTLKGQPAPA